MLLEPRGMSIAAHPADETPGLVSWVDDVDLASPERFWSVGHDATAADDHLRVTNHTGTSDTHPLIVRADDSVSITTLTISGTLDVSGEITEGGSPVVTDEEVGVAVENTDSTPLIENTKAIQAASDLSFSDDGDETATLSFTGTVAPPSAAVGEAVSASGDGTTTTFTVGHSFGAIPDSAVAEATSADAAGDHWVSATTTNTVEITYANPPPTGTDNLSWLITTTGSGLSPVTVSSDGATVRPNPRDLNFADGLYATDDGDSTVTMGLDEPVPMTDVGETITAAWTFDAGASVGPDVSLGVGEAFAFRYDTTNNRLVWEDTANATPIAHVDRNGVADFQQDVTRNGSSVVTEAQSVTALTSGGAADGMVAAADGTGSVVFEHRTLATTTTVSGDGTTATFELPNPLGEVPTAAYVTPRSRGAMSDFYVAEETASVVRIEYASPPPSGTNNLSYEILVHA